MKSLAILAPLIVGGLLFTVPASGQEGSKSVAAMPQAGADAAPMTAAQTAALEALFRNVDTQVNAGFEGRDALKAAMQDDMKKIADISDPRALSAAIEAYQQRYTVSYRDVLKQGGVDLNAVARRMAAIFPDSEFVVENGTHIAGRRPEKAQQPPPPPPAIPPPPSSFQSAAWDIPANELRIRRGPVHCPGIADYDTSAVYRGFINSVWGVVAGTCYNDAEIVYEFRFAAPSDRRVVINAWADFDVDAFAVALGGMTIASARAQFQLRDSNYTRAANGNLVRDAGEWKVWAIAPVLWMSHEEESEAEARLVRLEYGGTTLKIHGKTSTSVYNFTAGTGGSKATASIRNLTGRISGGRQLAN